MKHLNLIKEGNKQISDLAYVDSLHCIKFAEGLTIEQISEKLKDATIANSNNAIYLIVHEFGHLLGRNFDYLYDSFKKEVFENRKYNKEDIIKELGEYANTSKGDLFAESFADCVLNNYKASKFGKAIPKFLKDQGVI